MISVKNKSKTVLVLHPAQQIHQKYSLRPATMLFDPEQFNSVARETKPLYNEFIDRLSTSYGRSLDWWATPMSSRNTLESKLFLNFSYLRYTANVLKKQAVELIVCNSREMAHALRQLASPFGRPKVIVESRYAFWHIRRYRRVMSSLRLAKYLLTVVRQFAAARMTASMHNNRTVEPTLLVDSYVGDMSFSGDTFVDRYFGGYFAMNYPKELAYLPIYIHVSSYVKFFKQLRRNAVPFIIREDYLSPFDYIWALGHIRRVPRLIKDQWDFAGMDVTPLVREDLRANLTGKAMNALLNHRAIKRIVERGKFNTYVAWFEGQNHDKCRQLALLDTTILTVGYQGFLVSEYFLCLHPTRGEVSHRVIPTNFAVMGELQSEILQKQFSDLIIKKVPSFRFQHLFRNEVEQTVNRQIVLVALPIMVEESLEILRILSQVQNRLDKRWRYLIKLHPMSTAKRIQKYIDSHLSSLFEYCDESLDQLFGEMVLLISSWSSVLTEAIAMGVPVVIIGSQTQLSHIPFLSDMDPRISSICYDPDNAFRAISSFLNNEANLNRKYLAQEVRKQYFTPLPEDYDFLSDISSAIKEHNV